MRKIAIVANTGSGMLRRKPALLDVIVSEMRKKIPAGIHRELYVQENGEIIVDTIKRALGSGPDTLVIAGGDGTVHSALPFVLGHNLKLGIIPTGTHNHFAKDLGMQTKIERAFDILASGATQQVDVAEVNGLYFVNTSSIGIYAHLIDERQKYEGIIGKLATTIVSGLLMLIHYPLYTITFVSPGKTFTRKTPFVFVSNNHYWLRGLSLTSRPALNEGILGVAVSYATTRFGAIRLLMHAIWSTIRQQRDFDVLGLHEFSVSANESTIKTSFDGEIVELHPPLKYKIHPRVLTVIARQSGTRFTLEK